MLLHGIKISVVRLLYEFHFYECNMVQPAVRNVTTQSQQNAHFSN